MAQYAFAEVDELHGFHVVVTQEVDEIRTAPSPSPEAGPDQDPFERSCLHVLARDVTAGTVAASTRLLTQEQAMRTGGFWAEKDFRLKNVLRRPGLFVEASRTQIHPEYREKSALRALWTGIEPFLLEYGYDYLITTVAIPLSSGPGAVRALVRTLRQERECPPEHQAEPIRPLPNMYRGDMPACPAPVLLRALLRVGGRICCDAAWDPRERTANVLTCLESSSFEAARLSRARCRFAERSSEMGISRRKGCE